MSHQSSLKYLCVKDKLKEIELKEIKLEVSGELRKAVERATSPLFKRAFESVHTKSKNLKKLSLSMNKEALMSKTKIFQDKTENNLTPFDLHTGSLQMSKHATQKSKHAFINQVKVKGYHYHSVYQSLTFLYPSLYLSVGDLVCLGDCVRRSKHLARLKLPNLKSIESYMPILLAVGGSNAIQTLRIDSNTVSVWDKAFQLAVTSLRHNSTLRTLSLAHWTFDLQVIERVGVWKRV
ncbi:hypothetical protein Pcinc_017885 [Petrolisthes cinctipes]|uniref:Uncharacterized protein n=1 Tax=Petrolisthes cinctipes TaxID=88211 RepID=A0AAE1FPF5_PETCI|nr:hypothetical protein Pcinc_017885 [Petrolisthes cinctipes]